MKTKEPEQGQQTLRFLVKQRGSCLRFKMTGGSAMDASWNDDGRQAVREEAEKEEEEERRGSLLGGGM